MDNRLIDITSEGDEALALALQIVWDNAPGGKATHYKVMSYTDAETEMSGRYDIKVETHPDEKPLPTLILLWNAEADAMPLPYPLDLEGAINFAKGWLKNAEYGEEPDHDGSNGKGWRIFNNNWGHVMQLHYGIVGIRPNWAWYGK